MATPQDIPTAPPPSQHRLSVAGTPTASSTQRRNSASRNHSHSVSLGTFNPDHRVTRRKSINASAVNNAGVIRAAMHLEVDSTIRSSHRRSLPSKSNRNSQGFSSVLDGAKNGAFAYGEGFGSNDESAIADDMGPSQTPGSDSKARARRASEGSHLSGGKRASGELRCEKCGKGYKHSSCLTKHLWEHTPEWALTSKLLVSKHQQVQILEAASVLVGMNQEGVDGDIPKAADSDNNSSASPAASGSSGLREDEGYSSAETTPPPMNDHYGIPDGISSSRSKRYSGNSSAFSRSYQSAPSSSLPGNGFASLSNYSIQHRPSSSSYGHGLDDDDEAGLVAAVQSLCSFGTPRSGAVLLPADVPPVPPLPARFVEQGYRPAGQSAQKDDSDLSRQATIVSKGQGRDVEMGNSHELGHLPREYKYAGSPSEEAEDYDDGVFGGMEGLAHEAHEILNGPHAS